MPSHPGTLLDDVKKSLARADLRADDSLLLGFSGGIDSLTLTHALVKLRDAGHGPSIRAVHVDHGLRPGSSRDAQRAVRLAEEIGAPIDVMRVDVARWQIGKGRGIEAAARAARYGALGAIVRSSGTEWIALGHTLDDQVETAIFRLARGTSLDGLSGMPEIATRAVPLDPWGHDSVSVRLLRPLLHRRRSEIEDYAQEHGLQPVEDESNADLSFRRNAIRHQVIPSLDQIIPGAARSIARTIDVLADDAALLGSLAADAYANALERVGPCVALNRVNLSELPASLQRRVIAMAIYETGADVELSRERIEAILQAGIGGSVSTTIGVFGSVAVYVDYERLIIGLEDDIIPSLRADAGLPIMHPTDPLQLASDGELQIGDRWTLTLSGTQQSAGWELRTRRAGDRVKLGPTQPVRLQDWFVNQKVPRYLRDHLPLLVHDGIVKWIAGLSSQDFYDVDSGLKARLRERSLEDDERGQHDSEQQASSRSGTNPDRRGDAPVPYS